jgi:hypothetical protein
MIDRFIHLKNIRELRMKFLTSPLLLAALSLLAGCAQFPTSYSRIEPDKTRLLDFIYEPAEAAPGDTVLLKAVFAGKQVSGDNFIWRMSQKLIVNQYSLVVGVDTVPLERIPQTCTFSENTSCIAFRFVIPKTVIAESPIVPETWWSAIPEYYRNRIPPALLATAKSDLLAMLDKPYLFDSLSAVRLGDFDPSLLPALLQCFTVPIRIYCTIPNDHTIMSGYSVRYNSRFSPLPGVSIPVNRNPSIDSVGVYAVHKADLSSFDPSEGKYSFDYLPVNDIGSVEIPIKDGNTYFMTTITGNVDTTLSIDAAMGDAAPLPENHLLQWYLKFDENEIKDVSAYDLTDISETRRVAGRYLSRLYPSKNKAITTCTVWLEVSDQFLNEYYRPIGSTLREMRLNFSYAHDN